MATLSLCIIAKNEEAHIARCISSVKDFVDEIIVLDTGSTDRTKDIVFSLGNKVYDFKWTDDFSAARNKCIEHAKSEWLLFLDADEFIFEGDSSKLKDIITRDDVYGYYFAIRTYTDDSSAAGWKSAINSEYPAYASGWFETRMIRLFRNDSRIRFQNVIHECINPLIHELGKVLDAPFPIHHFGRLSISEEKLREKEALYIRLTAKKSERRDFHSLCQMGIQLQEIGKFEEAIKCFEFSIKENPEYLKSWLNLGGCYIKVNKLYEAERCLLRCIKLAQDNDNSHNNLGIVYAKQGRNEDAINSFLTSISINSKNASTFFNLGLLYDKIGAKERALFCFQEAIKINPGYREKINIK